MRGWRRRTASGLRCICNDMEAPVPCSAQGPMGIRAVQLLQLQATPHPRGAQNRIWKVRKMCEVRTGHQGQGILFWEVPGIGMPASAAQVRRRDRGVPPNLSSHRCPGVHPAPSNWWGPGESTKPQRGNQPLQKPRVGLAWLLPLSPQHRLEGYTWLPWE